MAVSRITFFPPLPQLNISKKQLKSLLDLMVVFLPLASVKGANWQAIPGAPSLDASICKTNAMSCIEIHFVKDNISWQPGDPQVNCVITNTALGAMGNSAPLNAFYQLRDCLNASTLTNAVLPILQMNNQSNISTPCSIFAPSFQNWGINSTAYGIACAPYNASFQTEATSCSNQEAFASQNGEIIGITIGAILVAAAYASAFYYLMQKRKQHHEACELPSALAMPKLN